MINFDLKIICPKPKILVNPLHIFYLIAISTTSSHGSYDNKAKQWRSD